MLQLLGHIKETEGVYNQTYCVYSTIVRSQWTDNKDRKFLQTDAQQIRILSYTQVSSVQPKIFRRGIFHFQKLLSKHHNINILHSYNVKYDTLKP